MVSEEKKKVMHKGFRNIMEIILDMIPTDEYGNP